MTIYFPPIPPIDTVAQQTVAAHQEQLTKPPGSLGRLEALSIQLAGMQAKSRPSVARKAVVVMAGDHGVVAEGVSAFPQAVTAQMVLNFLHGGAAVNVLARNAGARVTIVDMGVAAPLAHEQLVNRRVAAGTNSIAQGPAMSAAQAEQCLGAGLEIAARKAEQGLDLLAIGDMGIGNTTPSAAIAAAILGVDPAHIVGRGTGVDDAGLARKTAVVRHALTANPVNPADGLALLAGLGGFEIGGLAGLILGAAARRVPVLVDGFITTAAAMIAVTLNPAARDYLIAAHQSQETGHRLMLQWLGLQPLLDLDLRLGEGSGAVLAMPLLDAACKIVAEMATFASAGVSGKSTP